MKMMEDDSAERTIIRCPICGETNYHLHELGRFPPHYIVQCPSCKSATDFYNTGSEATEAFTEGKVHRLASDVEDLVKW